MPPLIPENISTYGGEIDWLFAVMLIVTVATMLIVLSLILIFVVRYRHQEGVKGVHTRGNAALQITWAAVTAAILLGLALLQRDTWGRIRKEFPDPSREEVFLVRVFAEQFAWHFVYPGRDQKFEPCSLTDQFPGFNDVGLKDPQADVVTKTLFVPVDTKVLVQLNSLGKLDQETGKETPAVVHGFYVPNLRLKKDVVPSLPDYVWFEAVKTGTYEIVCSELCGLGHYQMRADLQVMTPEELEEQLGYDWRQYPATFDGIATRGSP